MMAVATAITRALELLSPAAGGRSLAMVTSTPHAAPGKLSVRRRIATAAYVSQPVVDGIGPALSITTCCWRLASRTQTIPSDLGLAATANPRGTAPSSERPPA
jgi:hypothetical protein